MTCAMKSGMMVAHVLSSQHLRGKGRSSKLACSKTTKGIMLKETLSAQWPDAEAIREQLYLLGKSIPCHSIWKCKMAKVLPTLSANPWEGESSQWWMGVNWEHFYGFTDWSSLRKSHLFTKYHLQWPLVELPFPHKALILLIGGTIITTHVSFGIWKKN